MRECAWFGRQDCALDIVADRTSRTPRQALRRPGKARRYERHDRWQDAGDWSRDALGGHSKASGTHNTTCLDSVLDDPVGGCFLREVAAVDLCTPEYACLAAWQT